MPSSSRKLQQEYALFKDIDEGDDDRVRHWLTEFVENVGLATAMSLLQGVGEVPKKEEPKREGIIILGTHESGATVLSEMLVAFAGYNNDERNERIDHAKGATQEAHVILQNDVFLEMQNMTWYSHAVVDFDSDLARKRQRRRQVDFSNGDKVLKFINTASNIPWILTDPRLCVSLPTWMSLFDPEPAIVFTFRNPLEVSQTVLTELRQELVTTSFTLEMALKLWIIYNMRAVQQSHGVCRVITSYEDILESPLNEAKRISYELTSKCNVEVSQQIPSESGIERIVDGRLRKTSTRQQNGLGGGEHLLRNDDGCLIHDYASEYSNGSQERQSELNAYLTAMKVYCDLRNGHAFAIDYEWPSLQSLYYDDDDDA